MPWSPFLASNMKLCKVYGNANTTLEFVTIGPNKADLLYLDLRNWMTCLPFLMSNTKLWDDPTDADLLLSSLFCASCGAVTRLKLPFSRGVGENRLDVEFASLTIYTCTRLCENRFMESKLSTFLVLLFELYLFTQWQLLWQHSICQPMVK